MFLHNRLIYVLILFALIFVFTGGSKYEAYDTRSQAKVGIDRIANSIDPEEYLRQRSYVKKAGIVITCDDADTTFITQFVRKADSIAVASGDSIQICLTTGVMPSQVAIGGQTASWDALAALDQNKYEIALHQNSSERLGARRAGFSRTYVNDLLSGHQDSLVAHNIPKARTILLGNHRYTHGLEDIYIDNNIMQIYGTLISPASDTSSTAGDPITIENIPMPNGDVWPSASAAYSALDYQGYIRQGSIQNRWSPIVRAAWDNTYEPDSLKKKINLAVQTGDILSFAFHQSLPSPSDPAWDAALDIENDSLTVVLGYIADMMRAGVLESHTAEQAAARGCGRVYGDLLASHGLKRLIDVVPALRDTIDMQDASLVPLGWPLAFNSQVQFTQISGHNITKYGVGAATDWKLINLSADLDTVNGVYVSEGVAGHDVTTDSTSYGPTTSDGNVLVVQSNSGDFYRTEHFAQMIPVTGVYSNYIDIYITYMAVGGTSQNGIIGCRYFQWGENWDDTVNQTPDAYDFQMITGKVTAIDSTTNDFERMRIRPLFNPGMVDLIWQQRAVTEGAPMTVGTAGEWGRFAIPVLRPFVLDVQGTFDMQSPYGGYTDADAGGSAQRPTYSDYFSPVDYSDASGDYGQAWWITARFRVDILPGKTDWVSGSFFFRSTDNNAHADTYIVGGISAIAGRT